MNSTSLIGPRSALPRLVCCLTLAIISIDCSQSQASIGLPIPIEQSSWTDLAGSLSSGGYNSTTDLFTAAGTATAIDVGNDFAFDHNMFNASITISNLTIDGSGSVIPSALDNLVVFLVGKAPSSTLPFPVGQNMLTAKITNAAFAATGILQMEYVTTGGTAAGAFGGGGAINISMLTSGTSGATAGDFLSSFSLSGGSSSIDVFGVPEPASFFVSSALVMMSLLVRTRSNLGLR